MLTLSHHKVTLRHLEREAYVYIRQSSAFQVKQHLESQQRQYHLAEQARALGWAPSQIHVIDEDQGTSGARAENRTGFQKLVAEVGLGRVGIILGLEVSRLARNNSDWYQLLDLCALFGTLIADADGIYDPTDYNDRLLLGLKGTLSEAELFVLRGRLNQGLLNKVQRGELKMRLPAGLVRDALGKVQLHPDESVQQVIRLVFAKFEELATVRQVFLWLREQEIKLPFPIPTGMRQGEVGWRPATYPAIHKVLTNPAYAGAFVYGRTRTRAHGLTVGGNKPRERLCVDQWPTVLPEVHPGYVSWEKFLQIQSQIEGNGVGRKNPSEKLTGAAREGKAYLQGLVRCGRCGRRMKVRYTIKSYYYCCCQARIAYGGATCQIVGGGRIDQAVVDLFLRVVEPAHVQASFTTWQALEAEQDATEKHWQLRVARAQYESDRAFRQYNAVEPENRWVVRELERQWNEKLAELKKVEEEYQRACKKEKKTMSEPEHQQIQQLISDLPTVWSAETTTPRDRKSLLRLLIDEVTVTVDREAGKTSVVVGWQSKARTQMDVACNRSGQHCYGTDQDTVQIIRKLAAECSDAEIAAILNRQGRPTGRGQEFNAQRVKYLRQYYQIHPVHQDHPRGLEAKEGCYYNLQGAAAQLGVCVATVGRWLEAGLLIGKQTCPNGPWWIRITEEDLRRLQVVTAEEPGYGVKQAMRLLGVSRQTILNRIQNGSIKGWRIKKGKIFQWRVQLPEDKRDGVPVRE